MTFQSEEELDAYVCLYDFKRIDLKAIDAVIAKAEGVIAEWQVQLVKDKRKRVLDLLALRNFDAAMEAGQALFESANGLHNALVMLPSVTRDNARQVGTSKKRKKQAIALQKWLEGKVKANEKISNNALWELLPNSEQVDDFSEIYFYRDGSSVCYVENGKQRSIGRSGFDSRVTDARKSVAPR